MHQAATQTFSYRRGTERMLAFLTQRLQQASGSAAAPD
jgi:hypothetical protein